MITSTHVASVAVTVIVVVVVIVYIELSFSDTKTVLNGENNVVDWSDFHMISVRYLTNIDDLVEGNFSATHNQMPQTPSN